MLGKSLCSRQEARRHLVLAANVYRARRICSQVPHLWGLRRTINSAFDTSNDVHVDICRVCPLGQGVTQLLKVALDLPFRPIEGCSAALGQQQDVIKHLEDLIAGLVDHCCNGHPHMCYLYMHQRTKKKSKRRSTSMQSRGIKGSKKSDQHSQQVVISTHFSAGRAQTNC